ncbi:MAG: gliding motility-associated C-terminal domain-containing protein [Flavobacteriales bacterium]|jgi:gliding motility-associated-like protein|nr:gliding motility-associated C-terminal domain-containing protein [Flavobacteriales bacterium]
MHRLKKILSFILALGPLVSFATHNRGGEITYEHVSGLTYRFTITTCTDISSAAQADRSELYIDFGDGEGDTIPRVVPVTAIQGFPDHQKNVYIGTHTYVTSGSYFIKVEDPNRNANILNIYPNGGGTSDNVVFALQSKLVINPFLGNGGANNSLIFDDCPCPAIACVGKTYCYNPQAVDPDGDSLSYELVAPLGLNAQALPIPTVYLFPHQVNSGGGTLSIDPETGTMCWDSPHMIGEFNFTIKITEWRNGYEVGYVIRDVQLTVQSNCNNDPPVITPVPDICVIAGETIQFTVNANDPNAGDVISLTASGQPFSNTVSSATFNTNGNNPVSGNFSWTTDCSHIKNGTYQILFAAQDDGNPIFSDYQQTSIKIIPPKVTGLTATPFGNGVNVSWTPSNCNNTEGYRIYRTTNPNFTLPDCCDNPVPTNHGFIQVGEIFGANNTDFFDNTSLTLGIDYCYIITAFYSSGQVESCPSEPSCARLKKEVPIMTHVTVNNTNSSTGIDSIMWSKPSELDTNIYPGPYHYKIYHGSTINSINNLIGQTNSSNFLYNTDTIFVHNNINTVSTPNYYRVELFYNHNGNDSIVGSSNNAGSVFLTTTPNDNQITLNWSENVPWIDTAYIIYRGNSIGGNYTQIGQTNAQTYTDTNLTNGQTYCYYVKSIGYYSSPDIISPIENLSQEVCDAPIDKTPPCPPILSIDGDCAIGTNKLTWNNPNNDCADDVTRYNIYYTAVEGDSMELIATINSADDTIFYHNNNGSVAGCYYITSLDSIQYNNESDSSNVVCYDNCPIYWLPNVFSPNNDGKNEYFSPLAPYRYIESIDLKIFNRWGQIVYTSTDPAINWNGIHKDSGEPVPSGVYYYVCTVNTIRLSGIDPIELKGYFHLFRDHDSE